MIHFTGPNKPWNSQALPWSGQFIGKYRNFMQMHPELAGYLPVREHGPGLAVLAKKALRPVSADSTGTRRGARSERLFSIMLEKGAFLFEPMISDYAHQGIR